MPQMAPLSWLTLFILFSFTLILFGILNYFLFVPQSPLTKQDLPSSAKIKSLSWMW